MEEQEPTIVEISQNINELGNKELDKSEIKKDYKELLNESVSTTYINISEIIELSQQLNELCRIIVTGELKSAYMPG
jgi:hypothetical protein